MTFNIQHHRHLSIVYTTDRLLYVHHIYHVTLSVISSCIFLDRNIQDAHVSILYGLFICGPWGSGESYLSMQQMDRNDNRSTLLASNKVKMRQDTMKAIFRQVIACSIFFALGKFCWRPNDCPRDSHISSRFTSSLVIDPDDHAGPNAIVNSHKAFLAVAVVSSPINADRRRAVRQTWLNLEGHLRTEVVHFFVVGTEGLHSEVLEDLKVEDTENRDMMLLPNIEDSFDQLTTKVLATFVQLHTSIDFKYLLKVDDDSFVVIDRVYNELMQNNYPSDLYWGYFNSASVIRSVKSEDSIYARYIETKYVLCDHYIPYALGGGYVLSANLVSFISDNAERLKLYRAEDASVGTWLAPLKIERVHDTRFDTAAISRGCANTHLVSHKQSVEAMWSKQHSLVSRGMLCNQETVVYTAYEYNWNVAPFDCCPKNWSY